jgi:hypothetical protein
MTGAPPVTAGAAQARVTRPSAGDAVSPVGASGTATGTARTACEGSPVPIPLTAATVKSYVVPLVRPGTV